MNLYDEYEGYVKKYQQEYGSQTVVLYRCGSFYEIYAADDELVDMKTLSELLNITVSRRNKAILQVDRSNFRMAGFPMFALKKFVNILIDAAYTVVIVDQITGPPKPKRAVTEIISPGTKIDDVSSPNNNMLFVAYFEDHEAWRTSQTLLAIGVSMIDLTTGTSKFTEFSSTISDPSLAIDELYKILSFYNPKEIVISSSSPIQHSIEYLTTYLELGNICVHNKLCLYPQLMQKTHFQEQFLRKVFPKHGLLSILEYLELDRMPLATTSYVYLLDFCQKHNDNIIKQISQPVQISTNQKDLLLSYNTCKQLNVSQLINILNNCQTSIGRRAFNDRIYSPMVDPKQLEDSYNQIERFCSIYQTTSSHLKNIFDLERLYRKLVLKRLNPADLSQIDDTLKAIISLSDIVPFDNTPQIKEFMNEYNTQIDLQEVQKFHLDNISSNFFIQGTYEHLDKLQSKFDQLRAFFYETAKSIHSEFCKVEYNERDGYYLSITTKRFNDIKASLKGKKVNSIPFDDIKSKPISSSSTCSRLSDNNVMNKINQDIREVQSELSNKVLETYYKFLDTLNEKYGHLFNPLVKYIENVDWYTSCAKNVKTYKYTRPILNDIYEGHSYLKTKQLRHPIIERLLTQVPYVANDVNLGTDDVSGILLYGINSAGKSSISKAVGLSIIMAQAGMFVPCDELVFWPYNEIFTRIPSGDDMMKGQSTFVVEISELRNILKRATKNSLVIGDELASGTETVSALAIVSAGIVQLYQRKTSFIFATHLHDLCKISVIKELEHLGIYHMSVTYDDQKLVYDRVLKNGQGPDSYGVLVCKSLGLGEDFLNLAHQIRNEVLEISSDVLSKKQSRYNSNLFVDVCLICKKKDSVQEVHHIKEQHLADTEGYIGNIHKNTLSNLMVVCSECHDKIHSNEIFVEGYKQTSDGIELIHQIKKCPGEEHDDLKNRIIEMRREGHSLKSIQSTLNITMYKCKKIINSL